MGDDLDGLPENALIGIILCIFGLMILVPILGMALAK